MADATAGDTIATCMYTSLSLFLFPLFENHNYYNDKPFFFSKFEDIFHQIETGSAALHTTMPNKQRRNGITHYCNFYSVFHSACVTVQIYVPSLFATSTTSVYAEGSSALIKQSIASFTMFFCN